MTWRIQSSATQVCVSHCGTVPLFICISLPLFMFPPLPLWPVQLFSSSPPGDNFRMSSTAQNLQESCEQVTRKVLSWVRHMVLMARPSEWWPTLARIWFGRTWTDLQRMCVLEVGGREEGGKWREEGKRERVGEGRRGEGEGGKGRSRREENKDKERRSGGKRTIIEEVNTAQKWSICACYYWQGRKSQSQFGYRAWIKKRSLFPTEFLVTFHAISWEPKLSLVWVWSIYREREQSINHNQSYCYKQAINFGQSWSNFNWLGAHMLATQFEREEYRNALHWAFLW